MAQINLNVTPEFDRALRQFMKARGIGNKSEAIRVAVREAAQRAAAARAVDFTSWLGLGKSAAENRRPRFASDDDLWGTA